MYRKDSYDVVLFDLHKLQITMLHIAFVEIITQSALAAQCQFKMVTAYKYDLQGSAYK